MEDFNQRLSLIFDKYLLNAASFADKIGVQRSSMSHILSGRNKPSLDFILKIYDAFPEINLTWLTLGEGEFLKINNTEHISPVTPIKPELKIESELNFDSTESISEITNNIKSEKISEIMNHENNHELYHDKIVDEIQPNIEASKRTNSESIKIEQKSTSDSKIEQVMIFYSDGTFKTFHPQ